MKKLVLLSTFLLSTSIHTLPPCPSSGVWDNCFGTYIYDEGEKYVGEWKDNKYNGQGTYTWPSGEKYVGQYKDDKRHGQGTYTFANGYKENGYYLKNQYVPAICEDMGLRKDSKKFSDCVLRLIDEI